MLVLALLSPSLSGGISGGEPQEIERERSVRD
jgi:hypothetical protein